MKAILKFSTGETIEVEAKIDRLWWQERGLSYTASGYGNRIPTQYKIQYYGRWRRVYCCVYGNSGTSYIGKIEDGLLVDDIIRA